MAKEPRTRAPKEPVQPDELLVVAAILGDLDAFDELTRRYRAAAVRTAQSIVGREHAEDVAQEALLIAFKALPSIEEPSRFAAWLAAIVRHAAIRVSKREKVRSAGHLDIDEVLIENVASLALPLVRDTADTEELRLAFDALSPDYATVLRLHFLDEMPSKRIAAFIGVPVSTVKWRIHRGKALMREKIELIRKRGMKWKETKKLPSW
ncbi:MAG TPA: RNA polymerase sigma factor [Blastocatellia bacterium]|nr:RNA polymerase sigma factor [Blastocatellia bacterium]